MNSKNNNNISTDFLDFISRYVVRQVSNFFPDDFIFNESVAKAIPKAYEKTCRCINSIKAWHEKGFVYLNSGQYAIFLYYLSFCVWEISKNSDAADRIFYLNKTLNGIDLYYRIKMPDYFAIAHTVGMVFSKANYGDFCVFHQSCTVGRHKLFKPTLESGVVMFPGSMIIGDCLVKENTVLSPGVTLINMSTPGNCYVFQGKSGKPLFKEINTYYADNFFIR